MAAATFNTLADPTKAISAGTEPGAQVHDEVIEVMRETGIDLKDVIPQKLTDDLAAAANILVTMGCGEACPRRPGVATTGLAARRSERKADRARA
jgi:protein-tyrosine-phosphatase